MSSALTHYELPHFLSNETKQELLEFGLSLRDDEWTIHVSTKSNEPSVLNFYDLKKTLHGRNCYLLMIKPNTIQDWHTDGGKRNTALIYPLSENYAPCSFEEAETTQPIFLNTQARHAVFNNNSKRINLNISFADSIEECIEFFKGITDYELNPS